MRNTPRTSCFISAFVVSTLALLTACGRKADSDSDTGVTANPRASEASSTGKAAPTQYPLRGVIVEVDAAAGALVVEHEDIPGYMAAMTMRFSVEPEAAKELKAGQKITATLVADDTGFRLKDILVEQ